jgi:spore coat protein A
MLVNGQAWPILGVESSMYRFRLVDGSQARFYNLSLNVTRTSANQSFFQVGADGGLLESPVKLSQ